MPRAPLLAAAWLSAPLALACSSPRERPPERRLAASVTAPAAAEPREPAPPPPRPRSAPVVSPPTAGAPGERGGPREQGRPAQDGGVDAKPGARLEFVRDEPVEIGPSGPASATPLGVLFHDAEGTLFLAPLGPLSRRPSPVDAPVTGLPGDPGRLPLGRGPGFSGSHAYWVSRGSLVRRAVSSGGRIGPLEVLARDALDGTRVGVPLRAPGVKRPARPEVAAYIVRPEQEGGPLRARLWIEGATAEPLTPEGNTAHSVSLVDARGGLLAISVQARMALTPVHARRITFAAGRVAPAEDVVVWVGSGIHSLTELTLLPHGDTDLLGFMPHERSTTEFGVARLDIGQAPDMETPTSWLLYPNGIDPAPVAASHLCDAPVLFSVEPISAEPGAAQRLLVRRIAPGAPGPAETLAEAPAIYFVSAATLPRGALVTWVTDQGATMATTLRCPRRPG